MRHPTALLIPCPWSGDEHNPTPWTYWWWFRLYRLVRVVRHCFGLHDWRLICVDEPVPWKHCDWCGGSS